MKTSPIESSIPEGTEITIPQPDDFHLHLRDGDQMRSVVRYSTAQFKRALIMPNLKSPVATTERARAYHDRILAARPEGSDFEPLMTLYLTDITSPIEIIRAKRSGIIKAVKLYPAGATTNSGFGVIDIRNVYPVLEMMEEVGMVLSVHGEVADPKVDVFDREGTFVISTLLPIIDRFPGLRIVLEHISTAHAVRFVEAQKNIAATITAHHLLANRNDMLADSIRPDLYCKPILKTAADQRALLEAATSGNPRFFLGTDSAPHARHAKHTACGCAGCFTAHAASGLYIEAFESMNALDNFEGFASHFGADFYGLPRNTGTITLVKESWRVPGSYPFGDDVVVPFRAGQTVQWKWKMKE